MDADVSSDSLRAVLDQVFAGSEYRWREQTGFASWVTRLWNRLTEWLNSLAGSHPRAFKWLIIGLVLILLLVAVHAIWTFLATTSGAPRRAAATPPSPLARSASWYRDRAERLASEGQFAAALQAQFFHLALELDARRRLQFHPSKTPYEYSLEIEAPPEGRREFGRLVTDLYRFVFGGATCRREDWLAWRERASVERYVAAS